MKARLVGQLVLFVGFVLPIYLSAQDNIISVNRFNTGISVESKAVFIIDENFSLDEVIDLNDSLFQPYKYSKLPENQCQFWVKLQLENLQDDKTEMILGTSKFDSISIYFKNDLGFWETRHSGRKVPNNKKEYHFDANNYLYFELTGHSRSWIYLKIQNDFKIKYQYSPLPITVFHMDYFKEYEDSQKAFTYFFLGAILLMTFYNLILFFQLRIKIYLYYVLNNISIFLFVLSQRGGLTRFFFDNLQNHEYILLVLGNIAFIFYVLFCKEILGFSKTKPKWNRAIKITLFSYPFLLVFVLIDPMVAASIGGIIAISVYTAILIANFQAASKGHTVARLFLIGNLFYYFGIIISILQSSNIFPTEIMGLSAINYVEIGTIVQLTFFSLTLGYRINVMQETIEKEKEEQEKIKRIEERKRVKIIEEKNIELEKSVFERTQDLANKNGQLRNAIQEKEILLKEIHHRVKNNLQLTSSLLNLQSKQVKDENTKIALREGQARIKSMSMIHQKLYQSDSLSEIPLQEYLNQLTQNVKHTSNIDGKEIEIEIHTNEKISIDHAIPVGLISNELLTNSFKYAFTNKDYGKISISFSLENDEAQFIYEDDGVGIENIDNQNRNSLGLNLVDMLARQLHGVLETSSSKGLKFTLTFPTNLNQS